MPPVQRTRRSWSRLAGLAYAELGLATAELSCTIGDSDQLKHRHED